MENLKNLRNLKVKGDTKNLEHNIKIDLGSWNSILYAPNGWRSICSVMSKQPLEK